MKVLLIGASQMAADYYKVLSELGCSVTIVGRSQEGVTKLKALTGADAQEGGLEQFLKTNSAKAYDACIIAVGLEELFKTTMQLLNAGVIKILVEKPAGLNFEEIRLLNAEVSAKKARVFVAYNRRFFESVTQARKILAEDGGVTSFHFEFTEWSHVIEGLPKKNGIKENWFLANSTHVIDLAFFLGGEPELLSAYVSGNLNWHPVSTFAGSGLSKNKALFTYHANWEAPGRWFVECLSKNHRLILKPLEELYIQKRGSVLVEKMELDLTLDKKFKPGLFKQVKAFIDNKEEDLLPLKAHQERSGFLTQMLTGKQDAV